MKLYGNPHSACTKTALMALHETGQDAQFVLVDLSKGEHKSPEHLARHPFGRVPVLEDGDTRIYEVRAILRYLAAKRPDLPLVPQALSDRGLMDQWISVDACYFTPAAYDVVFQKLFAPMYGMATDEAVVERATRDVMVVYDALEAQLEKTPYLAGDEVTLADLCFVQYTESLVQALGPDLFARHPYLKVWRETMLSRPSAAPAALQAA
ncbi:glutathione S-transferase family protein [Tabrizicola aquatica]|uniref:glutathione S-transferase family protein n=1 Tax=Tabrizicola aquatica TaxID=909926 RepID=UPI000CD0A1FC|nr:glutathione binding-like protein [Tabrizicola aquatica]